MSRFYFTISRGYRIAGLVMVFVFILAVLAVFQGAISFAAGPGNPSSVGISNPIASPSITAFLGVSLKSLVNILIPFIVIAYIIVGLMFISARGAPEKLKIAKAALLYVSVGAAIVLGAWALTQMLSSTINAIQAPTS